MHLFPKMTDEYNFAFIHCINILPLSLMFLPHYDVYRESITEQTTEKCYLLILYNKSEIFCQNNLCSILCDATKTFARHLT